MAEPWSGLESQVHELRSALDEVQRRLGRLEARVEAWTESHGVAGSPETSDSSAPAPRSTPSSAPGASPPSSTSNPSAVFATSGLSATVSATGVPAPEASPTEVEAPGLAETLGLLGRVFLILGGGYLLRAITESGVAPAPLGLTLGMAYAVTWIYFADRAAGANRNPSALAHGTAAALLGFPLIWETSVRFGFLSPWGAGAALIGLATLLLFVARRRRLRALRWVAALGTTLAAFVILGGLRTVPPFAAALIAVGLATLWDDLGRKGTLSPPTRRNPLLRWWTALAADLGVLLLTVEALGAPGRSPVEIVLGLQLALPLLYIGSFGALDLWQRRPLDTFAMAQSSAAALVGLGGAVATVWGQERLATVLGLVLVLLAAVAYTLAFRVVDRTYRRSFHLFATAGMAFFLAGSALLLPGRALLWAILAVLSAALAAYFGRVSLAFQAALWALAAALAAHLEIAALHAFVHPDPGAWPPYTVALAAAWVAALVCLALPRPRAAASSEASAAASKEDSPTGSSTESRAPRGLPERIARLVLSLIGIVGLTASVLYATVLLVPAVGRDPGVLSVVRTAVLAATAVALAWLGRWPKLREVRGWVYPALVAGGLKLLLEDLPAGRPGTLFLSFVLFGSALILAPRLLRQPAGGPEPTTQTPGVGDSAGRPA